jgi:hypothetical protein
MVKDYSISCKCPPIFVSKYYSISWFSRLGAVRANAPRAMPGPFTYFEVYTRK